MSGSTIAGPVTVGVTLTSAALNPVTITSAGTITVASIAASAIYGAYGIPGTVVNAGTLNASAGYGVRLLSGGAVTNGSAASSSALITGGLIGVKFGARGSGTISNLGTIASTATTGGMGVFALGTGTVSNGSTLNTTALISGYSSGVRITGPGAYISNLATIAATGQLGGAVYLRAGGSIVNGTAADTTAVLTGAGLGVNIQHASGSVTNFGIISGTGKQGGGIVLQAGGSVINGSNNDTVASIFASSRSAIYIGGATGGNVANYGTITSVGPASVASNGISIRPGGTVTNGSAADTTATIIATRDAVYLQGLLPSAVTNFGTIRSTAGTGLNLYLGASVTNGTTADTRALIAGMVGIYEGGVCGIVNMGTISGASRAIWLDEGGAIVNGTTSVATATITGGTGITVDSGTTSVTNFGTIAGTSGSAIVLTGGGQVTNGSAQNQTATLNASNIGVWAGQASLTVANYGSITAGFIGVNLTGGGSVTNGSAADVQALIRGGNTGISSTVGQSSVANYGTISGLSGSGIFLTAGAPVINGTTSDTTALISGTLYGLRESVKGNGLVTNFGTILATSKTTGTGVALFGVGTVVNGATNTPMACIGGYYEGVMIRGANASVSNFGKITATSTLGVAVYLAAGGSVTNGGVLNTNAAITSGNTGVEISHIPGTVVNYGVIKGAGPFAHGVVLKAGGIVINGSTSDTAAYIGSNNHTAVYTGEAGPSYVTNYGTIKGTGPTGISSGVAVRGGGSVTNGAMNSTRATISGGRHGVYIQGVGPASVLNFGTIASAAMSSVCLYLGGSVTNGGSLDTAAVIAGPIGVYIGGAGAVTNFGTITGSANTAVMLRNGGTITNGSAAATNAVIAATSYTGTSAAINDTTGLTTVMNYGIISSVMGAGIQLLTGGTITNGTTLDKTATIGGGANTGIDMTLGQAVITNYGTIKGGVSGIAFTGNGLSATATVYNAGTISSSLGTAGVAIAFASGINRLIAAPGGVFVGTVVGAGITSLELATGGNGIGSIAGFGSSFTNIGTVVVDSAASWTFGKTNTIIALANNGTINIAPKGTLAIQTVDPTSTGILSAQRRLGPPGRCQQRRNGPDQFPRHWRGDHRSGGGVRHDRRQRAQ